jgi:signal transduction histidine kinase
MAMFDQISLRPADADGAIRAEFEMVAKGMVGRLIYALVVSASSLLWLPPLVAAAYFGAALAWELSVGPWAAKRAVAALRGKRGRLRQFYRGAILVGAFYYSAIPITGLFAHQMVCWYLAMMSFCWATITGVTYFSNDKWLFAACTAPSFIVATAAPFVFSVAPQLAAVVLALNAMFVASALQSALHRSELVESASKQEAARSRAEIASAEKSQFMANVSHELRTPLNAIIGYGELLKESAQEQARVEDQEDLDKVLAASRRLLTLVNEFLDISKIEAGKLTLSIGYFSANEMLKAAVEKARPAIEANGGALVVDAPSDLGSGLGDEFRLGQCVANLLVSAAKVTEGGAVTLRARRQSADGSDWFAVEAAGAGAAIPQATLARLFDPFAQSEASVESAVGAAGLGLAITRRIARLMGGDVTVESRAGEGSVFTLRTPVVVPGADAATGAENAPPGPRSRRAAA